MRDYIKATDKRIKDIAASSTPGSRPLQQVKLLEEIARLLAELCQFKEGENL